MMKTNDTTARVTLAAIEGVFRRAPRQLARVLGHPVHDRRGVEAEAKDDPFVGTPQRSLRVEPSLFGERPLERVAEREELVDRQAGDEQQRNDERDHHERAGEQRAQRDAAGRSNQVPVHRMEGDREHRGPGDDVQERREDEHAQIDDESGGAEEDPPFEGTLRVGRRSGLHVRSSLPGPVRRDGRNGHPEDLLLLVILPLMKSVSHEFRAHVTVRRCTPRRGRSEPAAPCGHARGSGS
jgi:hypothetical protein